MRSLVLDWLGEERILVTSNKRQTCLLKIDFVCLDCQIFNLLAGAASVIPGEWDSFMKFCQAQNIDDVTFYSYPPRSKFAAYMKDVVSVYFVIFVFGK